MQRDAAAFLLLFCLTFSCFAALPFADADAPWLAGWGKRELFYLSGGAAFNESAGKQASLTVLNQTGFNVGSTFYIYNETLPSFEDLRVTLSDGLTVLPIVNQSTFYGVNCTFTCLFPVMNASYFLYWGNLNASAVWNQSAVYPNGVYSGVVGAWYMNEANASDAVIDYSGNGNNGTASGTTIIDSPFYVNMKARQFNLNNSVSISPVTLAGNFTIICRFKRDDALGQDYFLGNSASNQKIGASSTAGMARVISGGTNTGFGTVSFGVVEMLAVTRNGDNKVDGYIDGGAAIRLYSDAAQVGSMVFDRLGNDGSSNYMDGVEGYVYAFNTCLNASEINGFWGGYPDASLAAGYVYVRNYVYPVPYVSQFGAVEVAPVPSPTVDPDALTADDAVGLAVAVGFLGVGVCVAVIFVVKRQENN